MEKKTKVFIGQIKSVDEEKFTVEAVVSDETIDRYGEVILADAYKKRLGNYKKHGVLLSSHNYGSLLKQIGMAESVKIEDGKLTCKFKYFYGEGNEEADWAWKLASKYKVAAFSVGFLPYAAEEGDWEKDGEAIRLGKKPCRKFTDVELLEVSQVLVPANPMALQKSMEEISDDVDEVTKTIIKEYSEKILKIIEKETIEDAVLIKSDIEEDIKIKNEKENNMKEELLKAIDDLTEKLNKDLENIFSKINELNDKVLKQIDKSNDNNSIEIKLKEKEEKEFLEYVKELFEADTKKLKEIFPVQS
ncbi:MAG: HK97 family phage prohead protease [Candidatus Nanoarchaeia archaeon]|nr:HK97 family phage prohead protease [Candidatus Nanoarchaeia archaeon]